MEMKWTPIVDGDFNEVPLFEEILFTIIDEDTGNSYVICDELSQKTFEGDGSAVFYKWVLDSSEKVLAWMDFPEPYKPTPDKCFKCNHGHLQHDEDSDNWFECELLQRAVPSCGKPEDCPLNR